MRVGIDTGLVFAGGLTEGEDTVKGMPVNLAARLESAAEPGTILISHNTYRHVRDVFDRIPLKPLNKRGSRALADEILQRVEEVPDELRTLIIDAVEGNPFYVEEMVKMLIDQGVIERDTPAEDLRGLPQTSEVWRVRIEKLEGLRVPPTRQWCRRFWTASGEEELTQRAQRFPRAQSQISFFLCALCFFALFA